MRSPSWIEFCELAKSDSGEVPLVSGLMKLLTGAWESLHARQREELDSVLVVRKEMDVEELRGGDDERDLSLMQSLEGERIHESA